MGGPSTYGLLRSRRCQGGGEQQALHRAALRTLEGAHTKAILSHGWRLQRHLRDHSDTRWCNDRTARGPPISARITVSGEREAHPPSPAYDSRATRTHPVIVEMLRRPEVTNLIS